MDQIGIQRARRPLRWAMYGAAIGLLIAASDYAGWRGDPVPLPWEVGDGLAREIGRLLGSLIGGALFGGVIGLIRNAINRAS